MAKFISLAGLAEFKSKLPAFIAAEGFIKNSVEDLVNYYKKSETYTQTEVQQLIAAVKQFSYEVVTELPTASASTMHKIYLKAQSGGKTGDAYDEYITLDKGTSADPRYVWEKIGDTRIDLSAYSTTEQMNAAIASAIAPFKTEAQIKAIVEAYSYETSAHAAQTYQPKEAGKGLSTNDFTDALKNRLESIDPGAEVNVLEAVKVDSVALAISDKAVNLETATDAEIDALFA